MQKSTYSDLIREYMPALVMSWELEVKERGYLQDRVLSKEYSVTGEWASIVEDNTNVMAYVTDMDSPFPRIAQGAVSVTKGTIPKIAAELMFTETDLTAINTMRALNADRNKQQILDKLFKPLKACYLGQKERLEYMLKQALSTGTAYADTTNNTGSGITVDFGFKAENKFFASAVWTGVGATPLQDIAKTVIAKVDEDGTEVVKAYMNQATFNLLAKDPDLKSLMYLGVDTSNMKFSLSEQQVKDVILGQFGFAIEIVKGKSVLIRDGKRIKLDGWKDGMISFVTEEELGKIVWASLAEDLDRAEGVDYQEAEGFILLRKYKTVYPNYAEYDSSQSRSLCVIKNNVYTLNVLATS